MESTKTKVLKVLRGTNGYISGQELCEQLGVSRTAVWKYMKQLKEEGYEIQAVQNKGYRLVEVPDVLGESEIKSRMDTRWVGQEVYFYEEIDSTNTQAKRLAEDGAVSGTLVVSDCQVKGKGRRGRVWESPKASAIYMTLMIRPQIRPERASMLTLVMGLSVVQAIRNVLQLATCIKWPNDVYYADGKICGMLIENDLQSHRVDCSVIGVGININQNQFLSGALNPTSLNIIMGHHIQRMDVLEHVIRCFRHYYQMIECGDFTLLHTHYLRQVYRMQEWHTYVDGNGPFEGKIINIQSDGHLIMLDSSGNEHRYAFGELKYIIQ